jgi:hypothetical protein
MVAHTHHAPMALTLRCSKHLPARTTVILCIWQYHIFTFWLLIKPNKRRQQVGAYWHYFTLYDGMLCCTVKVSPAYNIQPVRSHKSPVQPAPLGNRTRDPYLTIPNPYGPYCPHYAREVAQLNPARTLCNLGLAWKLHR